jgi:hypothetical protein
MSRPSSAVAWAASPRFYTARHCRQSPPAAGPGHGVFPPHPIGAPLNIHLSLAPLISLVAGLLILVMPKLLNVIVALYLIVIGIVGLFGAGGHRLF